MSSIVDICNRALIRAGAKGKISSLSEDTPNAVWCNLLYEPNRKALLRKHFWNFSLAQASLAQLVDGPTFEYDYAYQLPSDCLRLISIYLPQSPWKVIGREIYTNDNTLNILYVTDFDDSASFDPLFEECLVLKLAYELCLKINEKDGRAQALQAEFERAIREAKQVDGMEDYPDDFTDGTWLNSRY